MELDKTEYKKQVFSFYKVYKFDEYVHPLTISLDSINTKRNPTKVKYMEDQNFTGYELYHVTYDRLQITQNAYIPKNLGKFEFDIDEPYLELPSYYTTYRFKGYKSINSNYILFNASYKITDKFLDEINGLVNTGVDNIIFNHYNPNIIVQKYNIDLDKLHSIHEKVGIWFSTEEKIQGVTSTGVFGNQVEQSSITIELQRRGSKKTAIVIKLNYNSIPLTLIISASGSISIPNSIDEATAIKVAEKILLDLIS